MVMYRPNRGNLVDSMEEAKKFNDIQEMKKYIVDKWHGLISLEDIVIKDDPNKDERIGWEDVRFVCTNRLGDKDYIKKYGTPQCIGMCATKYIVDKIY